MAYDMKFDSNIISANDFLTNYYNIKDMMGNKIGMLDFKEWKLQEFGPTCIVSKKMSSDIMKPNLFVIPDISNDSFYSTMKIIQMVENRLTSYHMIYVINWCYKDDVIKEFHISFTEKTDDIKSDDRTVKYNPMIEFMKNSAKLLNHVIKNDLRLNNVHLLAKNIGAGIAIQLLPIDPIYTGLFLSSPSSPLNVCNFIELTAMPQNRLRNIKFRFAWNIDNENIEPWGEASLKERESYDKIMAVFERRYGSIDYISRYYDKGFGHEIHPDFICDIIH